MRTFAYSRVDPSVKGKESERYVRELEVRGFTVPQKRIFIEEVVVETSINLRDKFINLINYALEENDVLIVKGLDCLGSNFEEINNSIVLLNMRKVRLICLDFSIKELEGDLKAVFTHLLKMCLCFENGFNKGKNQIIKKIGRPEALTQDQKDEVMCKYKQGMTIYSIAKEYNVARSVIQRIIDSYLTRITDKKLT